MKLNNLKGLREDADMTQAEIAELLNCSQRVYSDYENGNVNIPTDYIVTLAKYFRVSTDYILEMTKKKYHK